MDKPLKKGKKKWFPILAPEEFKSVEVGETLAYSGEELIGRRLNINLMNLVGDPKRQNMEISLKIKKIDGQTAKTEATGYSLMKTYVKRLSRKDTQKIDTSYVFDLKDNGKVVIKPVIVTKAKTYHSVLSALRKETHDFLLDYCKENSFGNVLDSAINNQLQRDLKKSLNKIYPIVLCQFRVVNKV